MYRDEYEKILKREQTENEARNEHTINLWTNADGKVMPHARLWLKARNAPILLLSIASFVNLKRNISEEV